MTSDIAMFAQAWGLIRHGNSFESTVSIKQLELHYVKKKIKMNKWNNFEEK